MYNIGFFALLCFSMKYALLVFTQIEFCIVMCYICNIARNTNLLCKREGVAYAKHLRKISPEV